MIGDDVLPLDFDRRLSERRARQRALGAGPYTFGGLTYADPLGGAYSWPDGWMGSPDGLDADAQEAQLLGVTAPGFAEPPTGSAGLVPEDGERQGSGSGELSRAWQSLGLGFELPNLWLVLLVVLVLLGLWLSS